MEVVSYTVNVQKTYPFDIQIFKMAPKTTKTEKTTTPKTTRTPRKKVTTTTVTEEEVQEPEIEEDIPGEAAVLQPKPTETAQAIAINEIPKQAVTIWGRIKAWKYFWWVVAALGLILVFFIYRGVRNYQINAEKVRVENARQRAEELKLIIKSLKTEIIKKDTLIIQSQNEATDATNDRKDFEKKSEVQHQLNVKKNIETHETINRTDDERILDSIINSYVSRTE